MAQVTWRVQRIESDPVIMDITMPEVDGIQAVRVIKSCDKNSKIIMCQPWPAGNGYRVHPGRRQDFIVKPFQPERVIEAVRKVIG